MGGVLMSVIASTAFVLFMSNPRIKKLCATPILFLFLFVVLDLVARVTAPVNFKTMFNTILWAGVLFIMLISSGLNVRSACTIDKMNKILSICGPIMLLIMLTIAFSGSHDPATTQVAYLFFCFYLIGYLSGKKEFLFYALIIIVAHMITENRTIVVVESVVLMFARELVYCQNKTEALSGKIKYFLFKLSALSVITLLFVNTPVLDAFLGGDQAVEIGGVTLNTSGRSARWEDVYLSAKESIWFGKGVDVPDEFYDLERWMHPHNDYLRLLHRLGAIGLGVWILFFLTMMFILRKAMKYLYDSKEKRFVQTTYLYSMGVALFMVTDNTIVYSYVMFPFAVMVGISFSIYNAMYKQEKLI
ncbi:MAG: hypothetical protein LM517_03390 [Nitrosomonas sp.]|nr:hypothetical protein [Nitrosomonas sp.]